MNNSTYNRLAIQRNGIIYEDANDINLALGQAIITGGGYEKWEILGGFSRLNYSFKDRYLLEVNARYDGSSKFPARSEICIFPINIRWLASVKGVFLERIPQAYFRCEIKGIIRFARKWQYQFICLSGAVLDIPVRK